MLTVKESDPKNAVASAQYDFMYDDAGWDWGWDNMIDRQWNCVSIGIVYDEYFLSWFRILKGGADDKVGNGGGE